VKNKMLRILYPNTTMTHAITIPKPCHEEWNDMSPREGGRHCFSCAKTVVDFTQMPDEEVQRYLLDRLPGQVCGRFRQEQVQRIRIALPADIFKTYMPLWKRFLAASLLAFSMMLFSCESDVTGKVEVQGTDQVLTKTDTSKHLPGDTVIQDKPTCVKPTVVIDTTGPAIMGEIGPVQPEVKN